VPEILERQQMVAVLSEHAGVAAEFQAEVRKLPDLERLLAKAVTMLTRFQKCVLSPKRTTGLQANLSSTQATRFIGIL